ncbi:metallophosphoesterase [uncultured Maritimibacter sp.]|jgi:3',5'-cyclic AMP phosphodiesterase CpdA|uniref:metallophosphoesterase family protein n=1 Tax=uncultured Maritimibacter sp. TaxID=991866 RepID=UPI00260F27D4|nr:metallophosphoesterase [uncultured Maritimibacter sp.]
MKRIVHLSDLHFGRARPELLKPLVAAVQAVEPDIVVVSGDLTQRARSREFRAARHFLDSLGARWLAVPGNHDMPLFQPVTRFFQPYRKYREMISFDLEPCHDGGIYRVAGLNTTDRFAHQRGVARSGAIRRLCQRFADGPKDRFNIVVAHHPFEQDPAADKAPMKGREAALARLKDGGADVVLSGHLHTWHTGAFLTRPGDPAGPIQVHAGTSLSSRLRGEVNDFALLDMVPGQLTVTRMAVEADGVHFTERARAVFRREGVGLVAVPEDSVLSEGDVDTGKVQRLHKVP